MCVIAGALSDCSGGRSCVQTRQAGEGGGGGGGGRGPTTIPDPTPQAEPIKSDLSIVASSHSPATHSLRGGVARLLSLDDASPPPPQPSQHLGSMLSRCLCINNVVWHLSIALKVPTGIYAYIVGYKLSIITYVTKNIFILDVTRTELWETMKQVGLHGPYVYIKSDIHINTCINNWSIIKT